jgi:hypothetical protein
LTTEVVALTPVEMTDTVPETAASAMLSTEHPLPLKETQAIKMLSPRFLNFDWR